MTAPTEPNAVSVRDMVTSALRYWEPRRIVYNLILTVVVVGYFLSAWPTSKSSLTLNGVFFLFLLAVLANVAFCAAYVADLFVQMSGFRGAQRPFRWVLFLVGTVFAAILTRFFALGFFHG